MAHYQNGHSPYYGQPNTSAAGSNPNRLYTSPSTQQNPQGLRRMPSYMVGDDAALLESAQGQHARAADGDGSYAVRGRAYTGGEGQGAYSLANSGQDGLYTQGTSTDIPRTRAASQSQGLYYTPSTATSPTQASYNPQQYAVPPTPSQQSLGYNPLAYSTNSNSSGHQPYNPAAYQSPTAAAYGSLNTQLQTNVASHYAQTPLTPHLPPPQQAPPPPPPRGPDHPYGSRPAAQYDTQYTYSAQQSNSPTMGYNATTPSTTSTFPSGSTFTGGSVSSATSYSSCRTTQAPSYVPQSPRRTDSVSVSPFDEYPPQPPAHSTHVDDGYGKWPSPTRTGSGRSLPTPPISQNQPQLSPRRTDTLTRHPQSRPLPGPPPTEDGIAPAPLAGVNGVGSLRRRPEAEAGYDDVLQEIEAAVMPRRHSSRTSHMDESAMLDSRLSPDERHTHTNGNMATGTGHVVNYDAYSDDSDAEAAAGLAMLQMADEEERAQEARMQARDRRETNASIISAYGSHHSTSPHQEFARNGSYGRESGGYGGSYDYGDDTDYDDYGDRLAPTSGSHRSSNISPDDRGNYSDDYDYPIHQAPSHARVDHGGTGGLSEPNAYGRRMSFDYGDEAYSHERSHSGSDMSEGGMPEDLFFHPGMRPLPPAPVEPASNTVIPHLMPAGTYRHPDQDDLQNTAQYNQSYFPASPNAYGPTIPSPSQVPRSTSLSTHPIGPRADPPIRSKTDADRAKYRQQQELLRQQNYGAYGAKFDPEQADIALDLPTIPAGRRKKFNPAKLSSEQFKKCAEPWALSAVLAWIRELSEDETDLREQAVLDAIVSLFTHKVPTMNMADAETLAARVVNNMLDEGALVHDEEWVKFGNGALSGVLFQITGTGCYSSKLHEQETEVFGRCYSHHCMRTLKKVNLKTQMMEPQKKAEDWVTFYKVPREMWETYPKKEIDRQNNLHEIVTTEDSFIGQLDVLRELYRDQLATMSPPVIPNRKRLDKFLNDVFGKVDMVKKVNEDFLLAQLKYRQKEQGPFIAGFSDIFREWIRKAKSAYIEYAATFPMANYHVRKEAERNVHFRQFLNQAREHKSSNRLSWDTYLKAPITRIQRYTLLLATVHKNMLKDSEEKSNLAQAIEEIKLVALECDNKVGETSKKVDLLELSNKLQLRPEMKKEVELNLEHLGREIVFRGDLQRPGTRTRFLVDTHAILLDHYLILAKTFVARDPNRMTKYESYDVSKLPIPMDLLVLESTNDDPVIKSAVRGVAAVAPQQAVGRAAAGGPLIHTNSANSGNSGSSGLSHSKTFVPATVLESPKDDKILYPFKIKHLGEQGTYTLYAFSAQNRQDWCDKITEAKTKHAAALFSQNAEPFRLRVLADTAFGYSDAGGSGSVMIKGTPLDRAIKEVDERYLQSGPRPGPVCRTAVHSATVFQQPAGRMMCAIGTDYGVYISEYNDPRGWHRAIPIMRVTQVAVFEEFNLFLLIADKSLIAYHLDVVCPAGGAHSQNSQDSARKAPQKLSGGREVGFFAAGRMKDRTLVMYKKRDGLSSTFKVLEPVLQKSSTSRSRFFHSRRSQTEFFREYDEFYIPAESYGINMFHSSLAISTHRGIEILTIDKKQTWSVPDLRSETPEAQKYLTSIAQRIKELRPLGMFRLSDSEFLVAYTECAVYVNKHGDVSRSVVMEFVGRAHSACLYGKFLILFNQDFVEVRNAMNGRLRQVIPGHNTVCLDDGSKMPGSGANSVPANSGGAVNLSSGLVGSMNGVSMASKGHTVKICMQHPEHERSLIVLELIENEGQKD